MKTKIFVCILIFVGICTFAVIAPNYKDVQNTGAVVSVDSKPIAINHETEENHDSELQLVSITDPISPGKVAALILKGKPNTDYYLVVIYQKESKASGLGLATSDSTGMVKWYWKVGTRTYTGEKDIKVYYGNSKKGKPIFEMKFTVK
ncbi:MAG: hypothetical protein ACI3XQ_11425 [Eubacteriales bacterium]